MNGVTDTDTDSLVKADEVPVKSGRDDYLDDYNV
jgi:hypothetical protein